MTQETAVDNSDQNGTPMEQLDAHRAKYDPLGILIDFADADVHYENFATRMILLINLLRNLDQRDEDYATILDMMRSEAEWYNDVSGPYKTTATAAYDKYHELPSQAS